MGRLRTLFTWLGWVIGGLGIIAILTYGSFPLLGPYFIRQILQGQGLDRVTIEVGYPRSTHLLIPSLSFEKTFPSRSVAISSENIQLHYSLSSLLRTTIEKVTINEVSVSWNHSEQVASSSPEPSLPTNRSAWESLSRLPLPLNLSVIPIKHLQVSQLHITHPSLPPRFQDTTIQASLDVTDNGVSGTFHFQSPMLPVSLLTFDIDKKGKFFLSSHHSTQDRKPAIHIETTASSNSNNLAFKGNLDVNLSVLVKLIRVFYPIPPEIQELTGKLTGHWIGHFPNISTPSAANNLSITGSSFLDFHLPSWPPYIEHLKISGKKTWLFDGQTLQLKITPQTRGSLEIVKDPAWANALLQVTSSTDSQPVQWNVQKPISMNFLLKEKIPSLEITKGQLQVHTITPTEKIEGLLRPHRLTWNMEKGLAGTGSMNLTGHLTSLSLPSLPIEKVAGTTRVNFDLNSSVVEFSLATGSDFRAFSIKAPPMVIPMVSVVSQSPLRGSITFDKGSGTFKASDWLIHLPSLSYDSQEVRFDSIEVKGLQLSLTPQNWIADALVRAKHISTNVGENRTPLVDLTLGVSGNPQTLDLRFDVKTVHQPLRIKGTMALHLLNKHGQATFRLFPIKFAPPVILSGILAPWEISDMDVTGGTISANGHVAWKVPSTPGTMPIQMTHAHGLIEVKNLEGFIPGTIIEGVTTTMELRGQNDIFQLLPTPVKIQHIQSAIEFRNTAFLVTSNPFALTASPTLRLLNGETSLLGGQAYFSRLSLGGSIPTQTLQVSLKNIELAKILELEQRETIKGTGKLDGTIPLTIDLPDIEVHQGLVQAQPPGGVLHFDLEESLGGSFAKNEPNLDLVIQSLKNFHYHTLNVGVDYQKTGILRLTTRLEGENPDYKNGIPFNFNLNIEENIPALLKTLSLVQDLEEQIEKMVTPP